MELLDLVQQFPKSGYAEGLKHSLRSYYYSKASWLRDDPYMQKVRKLLDIDLKDPHLYPEDQRLEAKIQYDYPELTAIQKICDDLSEQSGVPLRVHPNLRIIRMSGIPRTEPLRKFMENSDGDSAKWIKDGDGYQLLPKPAIAEK